MTIAFERADAPRILVIRLRRFGDLLLLTPTLRAIRETWPGCRLDVLAAAPFHEALEGNPHVDAVVGLRRGSTALWRTIRALRRARYDVALDYQSSVRSLPLALVSGARQRVGWSKRRVRDPAYHLVVPRPPGLEYWARVNPVLAAAIGARPPASLRLELARTPEDESWARGVLERGRVTGERPRIALSVVSNLEVKRWPARHFAALADRCGEELGAHLILTNGPGELEQVRAVVAAMRKPPEVWDHGMTTFQRLGALYAACDLWIGNDGGPKHAAAAVGCPTVMVVRGERHGPWVDLEDPDQLAITPPPGAHIDDLASVAVDTVFERARQLLRERAATRTRRSQARA